jgi:hypothetical protein
MQSLYRLRYRGSNSTPKAHDPSVTQPIASRYTDCAAAALTVHLRHSTSLIQSITSRYTDCAIVALTVHLRHSISVIQSITSRYTD